MELGEDLNHLNAPKKITLKFPNTPPPPHRNGHNTLMIWSGFTTVRAL